MKIIWMAMIMGVTLHTAHAQERYEPELDGTYHKFVKKNKEQQSKPIDSKSTVLVVLVDGSKASDPREGTTLPQEADKTRDDTTEKRKVFNSKKRCDHD
jgi:hypothetical protein